MLIYQSSIYSKIIVEFHQRFPEKKLNVLLSYAWVDSDTYEILVTHRDKVHSCILDSGAWTDNTKGEKTDIGSYISYCKIAGHYYDFLFNLDSDFREDHFSPENLENLLLMERAGLNPTPVIHSLYTEEVSYYIERGYPIVALGSSYATRLDDLKFVFERFEKYPEVNIHVFGTTIFENLIQVPAYSVDSSSWAISGKFGNILYWNPENEGTDKTDVIYIGGRFNPSKKPEHRFVDYHNRKQLEEYLWDTFNFRYVDLFEAENRMLINLRYFVDLEERITEEHIRRGFPVR
jgi:hypothetical protein